MTPELKRLITDRYVGWAETWGLSFAYAITQSVEVSERILADSIVALIASEVEKERLKPGAAGEKTKLPPSVNAVRFAASIWEMGNPQAYRGFGTETFFRMPAITRAIVILKLKAQFSRVQIAAALHLQMAQVDDHLENARLLFSSGKPWVEGSPELNINSTEEASNNSWTPVCPQWAATAPRSDAPGQDIQDVFAQYVGNDLDPDTNRQLHSHLVACQTCRRSFAHFKKQYVDWSGSLPLVATDNDLKRHLTKVTRMALKINRRAPSPWPGLRRVFREKQTRMIFATMISLLLLHLLMNR